jgi:3-deoxy-D-manno-octulosonate 8-phosphate phosphatase (KDO 8-P phosphatase)
MIELVVLDVDGCLTDGKITYDSNGVESKSFDVQDGLAIATWIRMGKKVAIITGRKSTIVEKRANELKISHLYQGITDKKKKLDELLKELNLNYSQVSAIGDDLNDYKMLSSVGLSFTPNNGTIFIKDIVDIVLEKNGGNGAVREMIEFILKRCDLEKRFIKEWI